MRSLVRTPSAFWVALLLEKEPLGWAKRYFAKAYAEVQCEARPFLALRSHPTLLRATRLLHRRCILMCNLLNTVGQADPASLFELP